MDQGKTSASCLLTCFVLLTGIAGCKRSTEVTVFEAGVYQGAHDPLLQEDIAKRTEILQQRFKLVQTDR